MATRTKITITAQSVTFDCRPKAINDHMSYVYGQEKKLSFENAALRTITVRWVGTEEESHLPIWEVSVTKTECGSIMMQETIIGYGIWYHEGRSLLKIIESEIPTSQAA